MILEESKISIAMELIEKKIGNCISRKRKIKDDKIEEEYKKLLLEREEIYRGNYNEINKIIDEARRKKID